MLTKCRGGICPCRQCQRQCKIFASGVNFPIFTHFLCFFLLKLLRLGEIDGVKFLAWKSGGVKFWTNSMSVNHSPSSHITTSQRIKLNFLHRYIFTWHFSDLSQERWHCQEIPLSKTLVQASELPSYYHQAHHVPAATELQFCSQNNDSLAMSCVTGHSVPKVCSFRGLFLFYKKVVTWVSGFYSSQTELSSEFGDPRPPVCWNHWATVQWRYFWLEIVAPS